MGLNPTQGAPDHRENSLGGPLLGVLAGAGAGGGRAAGELLTSWMYPVSTKKQRPFAGIGT